MPPTPRSCSTTVRPTRSRPPISASSRRRFRRRGPGRFWCGTVSVARPLYARSAQRREILRQAAGDRRGDGRRHGRHRRGLEQSALQGWATRSSAWAAGSAIGLSDGAALRVVDAKAIPIQAYLGALGMPGVTAWYGLNKIIAPKSRRDGAGVGGDRRGRLGRRPAREARRRAGGRDRRRPGEMRLRRQGARLRRLRRSQVAAFRRGAEGRRCPNGVDGLFENVGGEPFQQALRRLNDFCARRDLRPHRVLRGRADDVAGHAHLPRQALQDGRLHRPGIIWTSGRRRSANWPASPPPRT